MQDNLLMSESVQKVHKVLEQKQVQHEFRLLSDSTRTAQMAADVLGCTASEIASSLIFEDSQSHELVLIVASGGHRVDMEFVGKQLNRSLQMAKGKRIKQEVGFAIGGVPPLAHDIPLPVYMDVALRQYAQVWAAAGSPFAVFGVAPEELQRATGATWLAVEAP